MALVVVGVEGVGELVVVVLVLVVVGVVVEVVVVVIDGGIGGGVMDAIAALEATGVDWAVVAALGVEVVVGVVVMLMLDGVALLGEVIGSCLRLGLPAACA